MNRKGTKMAAMIAMLYAIGFGALVTLLVAAVTATLIAMEKIGFNADGIGALIAIVLGAMVCAAVAVGKVHKNRLVACIVSGAGFVLLMICMAAVFFDGVSAGIGATVIAVLGAVVSVYLLGMNKGKNKKIKLPNMRR